MEQIIKITTYQCVLSARSSYNTLFSDSGADRTALCANRKDAENLVITTPAGRVIPSVRQGDESQYGRSVVLCSTSLASALPVSRRAGAGLILKGGDMRR